MTEADHTATYARGYLAGLKDAAKICEERANKLSEIDTVTTRTRAAASKSCAYYILKKIPEGII